MSNPENHSLLIVKSQAQNLQPVETFLKNRGWTLYSTTDLKEAISVMLQHQPNFVMISVDHPNKRVLKLSKVLVQAFPCCLISFAEVASPASYKMLSDATTEYLIYPPVTGPAIERTVNKFYKDKASQGTNALGERNYSANYQAPDAVVNIKGKGASTLQSLMAQVMGDENSGFIPGQDQNNFGKVTEQNSDHPTNGSALQPGESNNNISPVSHYNPQNPENGYNPVGAGHNGLGNPQPAYNPTKPGAHQQPGYTSGKPGENHQPDFDPSKVGSQYQPPYDPLKPGSNNQPANSPTQSNGSHPPGYDPTKPGENFQKSQQKPRVDLDAERRRLGITDPHIIPTKNHQDSIILKGSRDALEKTVVKSADSDLVQKLGNTHEVYCILIDSVKFSGYLLTAMARNTPLKEDFISLVRERLFKFLQAAGENVSDQKNMSLQLRQVPFEDWAIEQAEFLCKTHHNKNEIAMAFFPHKDVFTPVSDSASEKMCAIEVAQLEPDATVRCNVYLYLPTNKKYILYTPQGGRLYSNQIDKLTREGVTHVHILRDEVDDFHAYRAQNYLNNKIGEFERGTDVPVPTAKNAV